jgi:N-sulfoglucosamine sulfohydrolase
MHSYLKAICLLLLIFVLGISGGCSEAPEPARPNILFAISDDQSYPHASAYGFKAVRTPA